MSVDLLVNNFFRLIKKVETATRYPIKVIAFDFDCTLIPFHTGGCHQIYDNHGRLLPNIVETFFPNPKFIQSLIPRLMAYGIQVAIVSHSDSRFAKGEPTKVGGQDLILPLVNSLFYQDTFFGYDNVIAFSNPHDGTLTHKNVHMNKLLTNLNRKSLITRGSSNFYSLENILLIDDSLNNIVNGQGYQCLHSDFMRTGLSFTTYDSEFMMVYLELLNRQIDIQLEKNFGFYIKPRNGNLRCSQEKSVSNIHRCNSEEILVQT